MRIEVVMIGVNALSAISNIVFSELARRRLNRAKRLIEEARIRSGIADMIIKEWTNGAGKGKERWERGN